MIRRAVSRLGWSGLSLVILGFLAGSSTDRGQAAAAPPLSLEGYLDEQLPEASIAEERVLVDNSACYVCHRNYEKEALVLTHAREKVACVECHGKSVDHRNDEDNITPPDKMYALADIDAMCKKCHHDHNADACKVIECWQKRCPTKTNPKEIVCTDCHFEHRLAFRTIWWDKKTRALIIRAAGQRTKKGADHRNQPAPQSP